jgi:DNA-directed RNA polymerase beta subunit
MSYNTNRVDESYLQRLIDDLQQDHTNLFNSLKNSVAEKDKDKLKNKKVDKHTQLIAKLMNSALLLKHLLEEVKKIK